ncbi:MAG: TIGR03617 family F420-dependent LLM class oxidoreductase [Pseudomonadales bacterium]|nr:TIGR03617 family F420-dependent LLM class oxidoreductase [Pseudomonadales bacterium]
MSSQKLIKVDSEITTNLAKVPRSIESMESTGFSTATTTETSQDPFMPLLLAAEHSQQIELMTSIAVAFARTPMILANIAHDLNAYSQGRFILGLGSQVRAHITQRFSMPWSHPAARMKEFISAMRAIWACWYEGEKLSFKGEFYNHSLMTPMFSPRNTEFGAPKVFLAAVGPKMTRTAAEVADGIIIHPFTTKRYLEEVTLPNIKEGLAESGRSREDFEISYPGFMVTGYDEVSFDKAKKAARNRIAFYGSTPAYRGVLEIEGWGDLQYELNRLSKQGEWDAMGELITDEMLDAFAVVEEPENLATSFRNRYADLIDRTTVNIRTPDEPTLVRLVEKMKSGK